MPVQAVQLEESLFIKYVFGVVCMLIIHLNIKPIFGWSSTSWNYHYIGPYVFICLLLVPIFYSNTPLFPWFLYFFHRLSSPTMDDSSWLLQLIYPLLASFSPTIIEAVNQNSWTGLFLFILACLFIPFCVLMTIGLALSKDEHDLNIFWRYILLPCYFFVFLVYFIKAKEGLGYFLYLSCLYVYYSFTLFYLEDKPNSIEVIMFLFISVSSMHSSLISLDCSSSFVHPTLAGLLISFIGLSILILYYTIRYLLGIRLLIFDLQFDQFQFNRVLKYFLIISMSLLFFCQIILFVSTVLSRNFTFYSSVINKLFLLKFSRTTLHERFEQLLNLSSKNEFPKCLPDVKYPFSSFHWSISDNGNFWLSSFSLEAAAAYPFPIVAIFWACVIMICIYLNSKSYDIRYSNSLFFKALNIARESKLNEFLICSLCVIILSSIEFIPSLIDSMIYSILLIQSLIVAIPYVVLAPLIPWIKYAPIVLMPLLRSIFTYCKYIYLVCLPYLYELLNVVRTNETVQKIIIVVLTGLISVILSWYFFAKPSPKPGDSMVWEWESSDEMLTSWLEYDSVISHKLNDAFYRKGFPCHFEIREHKYEVIQRSGQFIQINTTTKTERKIQFRAKNDEIQFKYPPDWQINTVQSAHTSSTPNLLLSRICPNDTEVSLFQVSQQSNEFIRLKNRIMTTSPPGFTLHAIFRIQNVHLYRQYIQFRNYLQQLVSSAKCDSIDERELYHGTTGDISVISNICEKGWDRIFAGKHGTLYGKGIYFADRVAYSVRYTSIEQVSQHRLMFIGRVLCGNSKTGDSTMLQAPSGYHSTKGFQDGTNIFVTYKDYQIYPAYVLEFSVPP